MLKINKIFGGIPIINSKANIKRSCRPIRSFGLISLTTLFLSANMAPLTTTKVSAAEISEASVTSPQPTTPSEAATPPATVPKTPTPTAPTPTMPSTSVTGSTATPVQDAPASETTNPDTPTTAPQPVPEATPEAPSTQAQESIDSWMPNQKLQKCVLGAMQNEGIDVSQVSDITKEKLAQLTTLNIVTSFTSYQTTQSARPGIDSFSLEGLQYATNLEHLDLSSSLNYDSVIRGDITDISQLAGLTKLNFLHVAGNRITDISPIVQLQAHGVLKDVEVAYNSISNFAGIDTSKYDHFNYYNQIIFLPPIYVDASRTASVDLSKAITLPDNETMDQEFNTPDVFTKASLGPMLTNPIDGSPSLVWAMFNGARGGYADGYTLNYEKIVPQVAPGPAGSNNPAYTMVQLPYTNYLLGQLISKGTDSSATFTIAQPYVDDPLPPQNTSVTIHYQDEQGQTISADTSLTGMPGTSYEIEPPKIPGYTYKEVTGEAVGQHLDKPTEITYIYVKDPIAAAPVTVHYQDEQGKALADDMILNGNVGDNYQSEAKEIDGYVLKETVGEPSGTFSDKPTEITYVYTKKVVAAAPVTVHYQDEQGKALADDTILNGNVGENYQSEAKEIDGYVLKETVGEPSGTFSDKPTEITYVYVKENLSTDPGTGDGDGNTTDPGTGDGDGNTTDPGTGDGDGNTTEPGTGDGDGNTTEPGTGDGDGNTTEPGTGDGDGNTTEPGTGDGDGNTTEPGTGNGDGNGDGNTTDPGTGDGEDNQNDEGTSTPGDGNGSTTNPGTGNNNGNGSATNPGTGSNQNDEGSTSETGGNVISTAPNFDSSTNQSTPSSSVSTRNPLRYVSGRTSIKAGETLPQTGEKQNPWAMLAGIGLAGLSALSLGRLFKKKKKQA